jgi:hypothetical protein
MNSKLKCRHCGTRELRSQMLSVPLGAFCDFACASEYSVAKVTKEKKKKKANETKQRKKALKTVSDCTKEAQTAFNAFIRIRDYGKPCVSCDKPHDGSHQRHASHYRPAGKNTQHRFNLYNVHASCSSCNLYMSGNLVEYRIRIEKKIGAERLKYLETNHDQARYSIEYLERLKKIFNKRARIYKKIKGIV